MALLFGVSGKISTLHCCLLLASLIPAVSTMELTGNVPLWLPTLLYLAGTAWYGLFNPLWFPLWTRAADAWGAAALPRTGGLYRIEAKYGLLTQHTDPGSSLSPLFPRQQKVINQIANVYQQLHMLSANHLSQYKRPLHVFQVALYLHREHIAVSLHQPDEMQNLVQKSHAEAVLRYNAHIVTAQLHVLADDILYHRQPDRFSAGAGLSALKKIARHHLDNPVGQFCYFHFSLIYRLLCSQRTLL